MRTDYKDFIASTENRHYRQVNNDDGTISLVDETVYTQEGDKVSAGVLNELSQNAIWPLQHAKSGTTHQLTGLTAVSGIVSCVFTATADFAAGDTVTVDGEEYAVQMPDGESAPDKLFTSGVSVSVVVDKAGKKVNFKSAGGVKLPAGTFVIVKTFLSSGTFIVPISGKYKITVIGKGGNGGKSSEYDGSYWYSSSGAGGGAGGAGVLTIDLEKNDTFQVTVTSSISSFGSLISATAGKNGEDGVEDVEAAGGKAGTVSGYTEILSSTDGGNGSDSSTTNNGGNGGSCWGVSGGLGGTADVGWQTKGYHSSGYNKILGFTAFGTGGGGGGTYYGTTRNADDIHAGGAGGPGVVIIELLLKGVNDT